MPNLKNIKDRISSINNIQKITRAMKMVAAAKVKKAENTVKQSRPFTRNLYEMFQKALVAAGYYDVVNLHTEKAIDNYPQLLEKREIKTIGLLIITSNKGLAGAYSANVIRFAQKRIKEAAAKGLGVRVYLLGNKAFAPMRNFKKHYDFEIAETYTNASDEANGTNSLVIAEDMASAYVSKKIDTIELITTRYQNMISYRVESWNLLPVKLEESLVEEHAKVDAEMEFEPSVHSILQKIVPMYITNIIYQALLEASASELASRMTAMSAAVNNAQGMIKDLTVKYNKERQAAITQEISEVVSGADALK